MTTALQSQPRSKRPRLQEVSLLDGPMLLLRSIRGFRTNQSLIWLATVPMALLGLWGSWFSRYKGKAMKGLPKRIPDVTFRASGAVPAEQATAEHLQSKVTELLERS